MKNKILQKTIILMIAVMTAGYNNLTANPDINSNNSIHQTAAAMKTSSKINAENESISKIPVLTVTNIDCTSNRLSWSKIERAKMYILYLLNEETGKFEKYGKINGTSCIDKKLDSDTKYTYAVAAVFADNNIGKMSEPVSIYTYSRIGSNVQGNHVYYVCSDNDNKTSVMRYDLKKKNTEEIITDDSIGTVISSGKHIFYSNGGTFYCADRNGKNKQKLWGDSENYSISEVSVYDDMLFFSRFGASSENDDYFYDLFVLDSQGDHIGEYEDIYDGSYSSISFVYGKNDSFYIAWQGEEIDREASENSEYDDIITKPTGNICLYDCKSKKKILIPYADANDKRVAEICGYADETAYVKINGGKFGFISDEGRFVEIKLSDNSNHVSFDPKNGDIFFEHKEYEADDNVKKELFLLSDGKQKKIADLYRDYGIDLQSYTLCGQYVIYTSPENKIILYNTDSGKKYVLKNPKNK